MKKMIRIGVLAIIFFSHASYTQLADKDTYFILVDKSDGQLKVYEGDQWLVSYPVVFGNSDRGDKLMQGDRRTPEGTFHIMNKYKHSKWSRFMMIDYPNKESFEKFNQRKAQGLIPPNAQIGGAIGIHGTWPHEDFAIDNKVNWTEGCVSTKNLYIEKLFEVIPVGTTVIIQQ